MVSAPPGTPAKGAPPQTPKGPTLSFAAIVGGTSKFDEAARQVLAAKKNNSGKKNPTANTSATKVGDPSMKASTLNPASPFPHSHHQRERFSHPHCCGHLSPSCLLGPVLRGSHHQAQPVLPHRCEPLASLQACTDLCTTCD